MKRDDHLPLSKATVKLTKSTHAQLTEEELTTLERQSVVKLAQAIPIWYSALGPGLDTVFEGLRLVLKAIDDMALEMERSGASELAMRAAGARMLASHLTVPKLPIARQRAYRVKLLGGKRKAQRETRYEAETIRILSEGFPAWYDEVGFIGFLTSLAETLKVFGEIFYSIVDDDSVERKNIFFLTAFELRHRFGKLPEGLLEAVLFLHRETTATA